MNNYLEQYSKEQIQKNLEMMLTLEFLGIHIEDTKNLKDELGSESIVAYFFSVPEFSIIDVDGNEINEKIKSADGLISVAKESLTEMVEHSLKDISKDDIYLEEIIEDFKSDVSKFTKFYAKVRKGETWDKEMGRKAVEKISSDIKRATGYKEV